MIRTPLVCKKGGGRLGEDKWGKHPLPLLLLLIEVSLSYPYFSTITDVFMRNIKILRDVDIVTQCSPYQAVTGKIYRLKQQRATVVTPCNLLKVY